MAAPRRLVIHFAFPVLPTRPPTPKLPGRGGRSRNLRQSPDPGRFLQGAHSPGPLVIHEHGVDVALHDGLANPTGPRRDSGLVCLIVGPPACGI
jgi:hypothetical protein